MLGFDQLLDAHLDGLHAAGDAGWSMALAELQRWKGASEVFVCVVLALSRDDSDARLVAVWQVVQTDPQRMLRGFMSALAWVPAQQALPCCQHLLARPEAGSALQVLALRALALMERRDAPDPSSVWGQAIGATLPRALASEDSHLRAAACRLLPHADARLWLPLLDDPQPAVQAEAAISLYPLLQHPQRLPGAGGSAGEPHDVRRRAANALWQAADRLGQELPGLSGSHRSQAQHRLLRWVCHLGLVAPLDDAGGDRLLTLLPPRLGLWFVLHHGSGRHLPWVVQQMADPGVARLAGWVWSALTGIELRQRGLDLTPRAPDPESRGTDIHDPGLPEPDAQAIQALRISLPVDGACLAGQPIDREVLTQALWHGPQAIRWIASQRLAVWDGVMPLNIRAHARTQRDLAARAGEVMTE